MIGSHAVSSGLYDHRLERSPRDACTVTDCVVAFHVAS